MSYEPQCAICERPVNLQESKTDEHGHAVHENCYVWAVELKKPIKRRCSDSNNVGETVSHCCPSWQSAVS
jgi:hypothetical protein